MEAFASWGQQRWLITEDPVAAVVIGRRAVDNTRAISQVDLKTFHTRQRRLTAAEVRTPIEYERIHDDNDPTGAPLIQVS